MPTVLITGASRGLGLEMVRQYASEGWRVLACARGAEAPALQTLAGSDPELVSTHVLDVTDHAAVDGLAAALEGTQIDVLLNVAGTMGAQSFAEKGLVIQRFGAMDYADWRLVLEVNVLAPIKMAEAFVEHVAASGQRKIVTLTSVVGSIAGNTRGGLYAYRSSKAAANAVMKSMSIDLARRGIIALPIHPGWARTDMGGPSAPVDPVDSVAGMRRVIAGVTLQDAGRFLQFDGTELPW
jgi:NAD(P)-dependent dehydrogenase (short-subunit alcohol dehydrogenase family)